MFTLRNYQQDAVDEGIKLFKTKTKKQDSGVLVLPTGAGKSLVIASIGKELEGNTVVFQPNLEILEQNLDKIKAFDCKDVAVFSASANKKEVGKITFATIGSIYNKKEVWDYFDNIIIDECHLVNSKGGMYQEFIKHNGGNLVGLTATPYRLHSCLNIKTESMAAVAKMLTRTSPKIFKKILHVTQIQKLYEEGFLCPIDYVINQNYKHSEIGLNSTGMDFDQKKLEKYNDEHNIVDEIFNAINNLNVKHILVFNVFVKEAVALSQKLRELGIRAETISAKTPKKDRKKMLEEFKSGEIKVITNVGVLTTGFDFPELDCVVLGRPTQSIALYYQMVGRGIRNAQGKENLKLIDICGNVEKFGKIEEFTFVASKGKRSLVRLRNSKNYLTGFDFISKTDMEIQNYEGIKELGGESSKFKKEATGVEGGKITFGKHEGKLLSDVPVEYLEWCCENFSEGKKKNILQAELKRRRALVVHN